MEDSDEESVDYAGGKGRLFESGKASATRRIRAGPPQNSETRGRKVPPQVHLSRVEHMLQRATKNISVEHVHFPPPHIQANLEKESNAKGPAGDIITAKERQNFDEFDKLLGFRSKNPNPILRITSSFLGPLMRIIRIAIYATRIAFNVTAWRDPFLTFWAFTFLCLLVFVLLIMPWRLFFFAASIVLLGPQVSKSSVATVAMRDRSVFSLVAFILEYCCPEILGATSSRKGTGRKRRQGTSEISSGGASFHAGRDLTQFSQCIQPQRRRQYK